MALPNTQTLTQTFKKLSFSKIVLIIAGLALLAGISTGSILATKGSPAVNTITGGNAVAKSAQQDVRTFKDFAEGKITKKDTKNGDYSEGTHMLIRDGAVPVALTSSVVDLSQYEGKKVKVYGETQKAVKEGWLMDVGRVEVE